MRYRIHFIASFDITVDAPGPDAAKQLAEQMEGLQWGSWAAAADAHVVRCRWNTIEPEVGDDD